MKDQVTIEKQNESWFKIDGPTHFRQALSDYFSFDVENLHFMKQKNPRLKFWDGKVRLYKSKTGLLPAGLIGKAIEWMAPNNLIKVNIVPVERQPAVEFDLELFLDLIEQAKKNNPKFEYAADQEEAVRHCLKNKRVLLISPTSSGKSFIIYALHRHINKKMLIVVPTIQLTTQMKAEFRGYGFDQSIGTAYTLFQGQNKNLVINDGDVVVGTWQTLKDMPLEFFQQFEVLIGDEVHELQTNSGSSIAEACTSAYYKIGTTGSLRKSKMHQLALEGLFGPVFQAITTKELMDKGRVSKLKINIVMLKYSDEDKKAFWKHRTDTKSEMEWILAHEKRNRAIRKLALSFSRNTLIMFKGNKYGFDLFQQLGLDSNHNKRLFYVDGEIDLSDRQDLVSYFEEHDDGLGVVSYGTFQRGISIKNLIHLLYAVPFQAEITTVQSIGRLLRLHDLKDRATLWDFADDLTMDGKTNRALEYLFARVQEYAAADFEYEFHTIHL